MARSVSDPRSQPAAHVASGCPTPSAVEDDPMLMAAEALRWAIVQIGPYVQDFRQRIGKIHSEDPLAKQYREALSVLEAEIMELRLRVANLQVVSL